MPKEIIRSNNGSYDCIVSWSADAVQVGVFVPEGSTTLNQIFFGDRPEKLTKAIFTAMGLRPKSSADLAPTGRAIIAALDEVSYGQMNGLWSDVNDRQQVNALIRQLRRARDAAFGEDE